MMTRFVAGQAGASDVAPAIAATLATGNEMFRRAQQPFTLLHRHSVAHAKARERLSLTVPHFAATVATEILLTNGSLVSPPSD
jgi:hypothetical protein